MRSYTASPGRYINTGWAAYLPVTMQRQVSSVLRASWPIWTRRTVAIVCTRRVLLVTTHLTLYSLPWLAGPFVRLAGTGLKFRCSGMCTAGFSVVSAPCAVLPEVYRKIGLRGIWRLFFPLAPCIWKSLVVLFT